MNQTFDQPGITIPFRRNSGKVKNTCSDSSLEANEPLDMECLGADELRELMPSMTPQQLEQLLPEDEFRRGCTLSGVPGELLQAGVLNLEPSNCGDVSVRYFDLMQRMRRLIDSRRCLLFEQVRVMVNHDFTDDIFQSLCALNSTTEERLKFMAKPRTERMHIVAHVWARMCIRAGEAAAAVVDAAVDEVAAGSSAAASPQDPQWVANVVADAVANVVDADAVANVAAANVAACEAEPEWAEPIAAVRCEGRPQVWLDMERLTVEQAQAHFPGTTCASLEQLLPEEEFRRGSTLTGVEAWLLKPMMLNVRPDEFYSADSRVNFVLYSISRLIRSRRCLLFEQVRALLNSDFTNECYNAVIDAFASESEREDFLSMSRTERLHAVAQLWIITVLTMRKDCKQQQVA